MHRIKKSRIYTITVNYIHNYSKKRKNISTSYFDYRYWRIDKEWATRLHYYLFFLNLLKSICVFVPSFLSQKPKYIYIYFILNTDRLLLCIPFNGSMAFSRVIHSHTIAMRGMRGIVTRFTWQSLAVFIFPVVAT